MLVRLLLLAGVALCGYGLWFVAPEPVRWFLALIFWVAVCIAVFAAALGALQELLL